MLHPNLPTPDQGFLQHYETIADVSGAMLRSASAQDWDAVLDLSIDYFHAVEKLRNLKPLNEGQKAARRSVLLQILNNDARIRDLAQPELRRLSSLLAYSKRQKTALDTYGHAEQAQ